MPALQSREQRSGKRSSLRQFVVRRRAPMAWRRAVNVERHRRHDVEKGAKEREENVTQVKAVPELGVQHCRRLQGHAKRCGNRDWSTWLVVGCRLRWVLEAIGSTPTWLIAKDLCPTQVGPVENLVNALQSEFTTRVIVTRKLPIVPATLEPLFVVKERV